MKARRDAEPVAIDEHPQVRPPYDARWLGLIIVAVTVGLLMAFSASFPQASSPDRFNMPGDAFHYFKLHLLFVLIGMAGMFVFSLPRPLRFQQISLLAFVLSLAFMVVCLALGHKTRGTVQWVPLGPFRVQPSEFAKLAFIVYVASKLSLGPLTPKTFRKILYPVGLATISLCILLLFQGDQGMAVLVFLIALAMCYLAGLPVPTTCAIGGLAAFLASALAFSSSLRTERILSWLDPVGHRTTAGYHILTMLVAISRGWLTGLGLGMCPDKWRQMPEPHTDSIFCVMGSELGLVGLLGFLILMALIIIRTFQVARWSRDGFGYFLASGIGIMLAIQALINMLVATNLMPVTGLTLPFISYGGSSLISCLMAAGMVMSVYRHNPPLRREA